MVHTGRDGAPQGGHGHGARAARRRQDGEWHLVFWSQDAAGNAEEAGTVIVKIDTWAPVATSTSDGAIASGSSSIKLSATDVNADPTITANSGVTTIEYAVDDGAPGAGSARPGSPLRPGPRPALPRPRH